MNRRELLKIAVAGVFAPTSELVRAIEQISELEPLKAPAGTVWNEHWSDYDSVFGISALFPDGRRHAVRMHLTRRAEKPSLREIDAAKNLLVIWYHKTEVK